MRRWLVATLLAALAGSLSAQTEPPSTADLSAPDAVIAAESLANSAIGLAHTPGVPGRGQRLTILAEFALHVQPDDQAVNRILADVYLIQGDSAHAAQMLRQCLSANPGDYNLLMQWLASSLASLQTAEARLSFLDSVIRDESLPPSIRAEALVGYAEVLIGRGDASEAEELFAAAIQLDPYHYGALQGWTDRQESMSVVDSANLMFRMLRGSPLDANVAHDLGVLMGSIGLWKDAVTFFDHAWAIASRDVGVDAIPHAWVVEYANAMIDAGQLERAVDTFQPMLERYPNSVDLRALLVEANLGLGDNEQAVELVNEIERTYHPVADDTDLGSYDVDMAMFYLTTRPDDRLAMAHARGAMQGADPEQRQSVVLQRLLGGAELVAGSIDSGVQRLTTIQDTDIYASVFLALHYFNNGQPELGQQAVLTGAKLGRSGPAFRRLDSMARQNGVAVPTVAGAAQVSRMILAFNDLYLQMGLYPERFVEVSIAPPDRPFAVGEPIVLTMLLHNAGPIALPVGPNGLFEPAAAVQVNLAGPWEEPILVTNLPLAVLPSPHQLEPDETVRCRIRLDVGRLGNILAAHPLSEITMTVSGIFDPVQRDSGLFGSLPGVGIEPITVTRTSLIDMVSSEDVDLAAQATQDAMAAIAADIAGGDIGLRVRAARQVGALKVFLARVEAGQAEAPDSLPRETIRGQLAEYQESLLGDGSAVVRAEMIHSLHLASVADRAMVLPTGLDDPSPLVRLRTAELLGTMDDRDRTSRQMLARLADDPDPLVAEMAGVFLEGTEYETAANESDAVTSDEPAAPRTPVEPDDEDNSTGQGQ